MQLNREAPHFWNLPRDTFCSDQPIILTHWGWDETNKTSFLQWKCFEFRLIFLWNLFVGNLTIIVSDNGLLLGRRQAIIWNNAGILLMRPLVTNPSIILIATETFSFKKMHLKISSGKCRPFCLGLNMLKKYIKSVSIYMLSLVLYEFRWRPHNLLLKASRGQAIVTQLCEKWYLTKSIDICFSLSNTNQIKLYAHNSHTIWKHKTISFVTCIDPCIII